MKYLFFLLVILLCLLGCERARDIIPWVPNPLIGSWTGSFSATYPGPDDGAVVVEDSIQLVLTDYSFFYYRFGGDNVDTLVDGRGNYTHESNVIFSNEMVPETNPPLRINGAFNLRFGYSETEPDTMILTQGGTPDLDSFFETIYLMELVKTDEIPE